MIPGEFLIDDGEIEFNSGLRSISVAVTNTGDRPIQVGSHYHFYEVNPALSFDRAATLGMHLDITPSTAVRFEPGLTRTVTLVPFQGERRIYGFRQEVMGKLKVEGAHLVQNLTDNKIQLINSGYNSMHSKSAKARI